MNPMIGAAAMSLSSFTVCMNALRLNLFKMQDSSHDRPLRKRALPETDEPDTGVAGQPAEATSGAVNAGQKTLHIEGMMCHHCEAAIKKALEKLDFVEEATADFEAGTALVTLSGEMDEEAVRQAIAEEDYNYLGME